jgi:chromosomal replication initiation ATPase DnaA
MIIQKETDMSTILQVITRYYNITEGDLFGSNRKIEITKPRFLFIYFSRMLTQNSYERIGIFLKDRGRKTKYNHGSMISALKKIMYNPRYYQDDITKISKLLKRDDLIIIPDDVNLLISCEKKNKKMYI